jgi:hypothetical protein
MDQEDGTEDREPLPVESILLHGSKAFGRECDVERPDSHHPRLARSWCSVILDTTRDGRKRLNQASVSIVSIISLRTEPWTMNSRISRMAPIQSASCVCAPISRSYSASVS